MNTFPFCTSYWFDSQIATSPALSEAQFADVAVVGGGFAGLSAAQHLKASRPTLSIALVEARHIGFGASGRNAGWVMSLPPLYWLLDDLADRQRLADIRWTSQVCRENIAQLGRLVAQEGIDCAWTPSRHLLTARNPLEVATLRWLMPRFEAIGQQCEFFEKGEMSRLVGYPAVAGLAYEIVSIQPYRLARGLRQRCLDLDIRIYENTPIKSMRSTAQGVQLIAADGATLTAQKVILATNAYTKSLLLDVETPATSTQHTYMLATEPLKPDMLDRISQARTPFGDAALSFYIGRIHEDRLIFNGIDRASQVTPEDDRHLPSFARLHQEMLRRFPFLESVPLAGAWGGAVQQTTTDAPIVQRSKSNPHVILNIGYGGGSGVGMALLSGQLTTGLVMEDDPIANDAQRLRTLLATSCFPKMGPVRAAFGVFREMIFGTAPTWRRQAR
jgi:glycine/D-amino acid oxidase-like deaminating enzyme